MIFTIRKSKIPGGGYEITAQGYHNIAPSVLQAISIVKERYGREARIRVIMEDVLDEI